MAITAKEVAEVVIVLSTTSVEVDEVCSFAAGDTQK